jgi:hypothetical protein
MVQRASGNSWRIEVNDPHRPNKWSPLWKIDANQYLASEELVEQLNRINYPIQVRIAPDPD